MSVTVHDPSGDSNCTDVHRDEKFLLMRDKVEQWCRDFWRPHHGSTRHVEQDDGNQMIEKKKSGGHMPLNAAVIATWGNGKLANSRRLFGRVLAELGLEDRVAFAEIQDLFGRYGASDSDYDFLRIGVESDRKRGQSIPLEDPPLKAHKGAKRPEGAFLTGERSAANANALADPKVCRVERQLRLAAIDRGIDAMTEGLLSWGITDRDFWADFGLREAPTKRTRNAQAEKRKRYDMFLMHCKAFEREGFSQVRNKAYEATARDLGCAKSTVKEAVGAFESGYIQLDEAS